MLLVMQGKQQHTVRPEISSQSQTQSALICCEHLMVSVDAQIGLFCRSTWYLEMT